MTRSTAGACEFEELSAERRGLEELTRFYQTLYVKQFPDPDERESLANMRRYLRLKRGRFYGKSNYHILLAKRAGRIVGASICDYLALPNAGVIEFLFTVPGARARGLGKQLLAATVRVLERDARKSGHRPLRAVVAEMNDPFVKPETRDNMDPFARALIWSKWGFAKLGFSYVQPALSAGQAPVSGLLFIMKPLRRADRTAVERRFVLQAVGEYMRLAMRIPAPRQNPQYRTMATMLRGTPRVPLVPLDAYVGPEPLRFTIEALAGHSAGFGSTYALIRREIDRARVVPRAAFERALARSGTRIAYHLWAIRSASSTRIEGAASFFALESVGFGGYVVLAGTLRGRGLLRPLLDRIEETMRRDRPHARGWFVECGDDSRAIFEHVGFAALPGVYQPPALGTTRTSQGALTLLYKEFGSDRARLPSRARSLAGCAEILRYVYGIARPERHPCYRAFAARKQGVEKHPAFL